MKISIKHIVGSDWIVACMIPKGNMMASMLKKVEDGEGFKLVNFNCSNKKETPKENKELEDDFKVFLEKGISNLVREGELNFPNENALNVTQSYFLLVFT